MFDDKPPLLVSSLPLASLVSGDHTVHVLSFIITFGKCTAFQVAFSFWDSVSRYAILVRHGPGTTFLGFLAFLGWNVNSFTMNIGPLGSVQNFRRPLKIYILTWFTKAVCTKFLVFTTFVEATSWAGAVKTAISVTLPHWSHVKLKKNGLKSDPSKSVSIKTVSENRFKMVCIVNIVCILHKIV